MHGPSRKLIAIAAKVLVPVSPCRKINVIMMLTFYPPLPPFLNVTAFQHTFNTILLHLAYTFSIHLYSTVLAMTSWIHCIIIPVRFLLACSYVHTFSYVVLDMYTTVTKMQILTLLEVCLDLFNHKNAY